MTRKESQVAGDKLPVGRKYREEKAIEKTSKYGTLCWELQHRHPDYKVTRHNIIIDIPGGYTQDLTKTLKELVGNRYRSVAA